MGNGGLVDFDFASVQNLINNTDSSQQDQLSAHRSHQGRDYDNISGGLAGTVMNAAMSKNQERSEIYDKVHAFAQTLVEKGNSAVNITGGSQADALQTFARQSFGDGGAIDGGINPQV
ncbi:hypothetical protein [Amycolatopsis decaplanina]|uniref:Uncharacterized protein n=1 Tax=Amycolatopsis decaplanina DSM 44594 TaxID=1284240 RepID=M2ZDT2_9PSEU|nr:hypothetical protein [Amycolatopsis decaplanina]EME58534.1 hypothetical protein H074_18183 [Amycolatopsis decaplanina DSM 44594]